MRSEQQASKQTLTEALRALQRRGVGEHVFADFRAMDPETILDTCRWFDEQNGRVGAGVLVEELRAGGRTPRRPSPQRVNDRQREYGAEVGAWIAEHLPNCCGYPTRHVEACARAFGQDFAAGLARDTGPHQAAVGRVMQIHRRDGRHALSVARHGAEIRAAVKAATERAIADYQDIEAANAGRRIP